MAKQIYKQWTHWDRKQKLLNLLNNPACKLGSNILRQVIEKATKRNYLSENDAEKLKKIMAEGGKVSAKDILDALAEKLRTPRKNLLQRKSNPKGRLLRK